MKRLFAIYCAIILACAGSAYASLASNYNANTRSYRSGFYNGDRDWVWVMAPNGNAALYKLDGRYVEAVIINCPLGHHFTEADIWGWINSCSDRAGQSWRQYASDSYGGRDYCTNDNRLVAKVFWMNGQHAIRVCYASFATKQGLWRYDKSMPSIRPKARGKPKPKELLPPVQEQ